MSIYDEAIKIFNGTETDRTQEEALAIVHLSSVIKEDYILLLSEDEFNIIYTALKRAKKVEEELEKYKRNDKGE